ncbi:MAG: hypothetical protein U0223_07535 [Nitrospira sp.]|nr:hypothetical protein [Nitrospira sp.]
MKSLFSKIDRESTESINVNPDPSMNARMSSLSDRISALREREHDARRQESDLIAQLRMSHATSSIHDLTRLLMKDATAQPAAAAGVQEKLQDCQVLLESIRRAIEATKQDMLQLQCERDAQVCREMLPTHTRNVRATINCILALHRSTVNQNALRLELNLKGVERTGHLIPLFPPQFLGGMDDSNSWLSFVMRGAVSDGFMSEQERGALMRGELKELAADR